MKYRFSKTTPNLQDRRNLKEALESKSEYIVISFGNFYDLKKYVEKFEKKGKKVFIKVSDIKGLKDDDDAALTYLMDEVGAYGIISNKSRVISKAKKVGLVTIYTAFILDTQSIITSIRNIKNIRPDIVELRPGIIPKVVKEMRRKIDTPIWASSLFTEEEEVEEVIGAGAESILTGWEYLWSYE